VAIKRFKANEGDSDRIFKVPLNQPFASSLLKALNFHSAVVSGGHWLETFIPSEHLPSLRDFYVRGPATFLHSLRVDAQWERDAICKIQSGGKPSANGGPLAVSSRPAPIFTNHFSSLMSCLVWPTFTDSGLFTGISKA